MTKEQKEALLLVYEALEEGYDKRSPGSHFILEALDILNSSIFEEIWQEAELVALEGSS